VERLRKPPLLAVKMLDLVRELLRGTQSFRP
jgi:hypothetical protein